MAISAAGFEYGIRSNRIRTFFLLASLFLMLTSLLYLLALSRGWAPTLAAPIIILISTLATWLSWYRSDTLVLRLTRAEVVEYDQAPQVHNLVEEICLASGLPKPKIAIITDPAPNAFATGRDPEHALIAYTTGLLKLMNRQELQGVTAHELAHIANRDTLVMTIAATTAGAIALLGDLIFRFGGLRSDRSTPSHLAVLVALILAALLAPLAALLLKAGVSRRRETLADFSAVSFTRNPAGLRSALEKLESNSAVVQARSTATAHLWIECPLQRRGLDRIFSTHPPLSQRIAALRNLEG